jgi:hypothetical protein
MIRAFFRGGQDSFVFDYFEFDETGGLRAGYRYFARARKFLGVIFRMTHIWAPARRPERLGNRRVSLLFAFHRGARAVLDLSRTKCASRRQLQRSNDLN